MADKKEKRWELLRAAMTFGGPKEAPTNYEASVLPDIPGIGRTVGIETTPNDPNDSPDELANKEILKKKRQGIVSSLMQRGR